MLGLKLINISKGVPGDSQERQPKHNKSKHNQTVCLFI